MVLKGVISIKAGATVRQLLDSNQDIAYLRTATMSPNSPTSPINPPSGYLDKSYVAEHDMQLTLHLNQTVMDSDGNPYAPILEQ